MNDYYGSPLTSDEEQEDDHNYGSSMMEDNHQQQHQYQHQQHRRVASVSDRDYLASFGIATYDGNTGQVIDEEGMGHYSPSASSATFDHMFMDSEQQPPPPPSYRRKRTFSGIFTDEKSYEECVNLQAAQAGVSMDDANVAIPDGGDESPSSTSKRCKSIMDTYGGSKVPPATSNKQWNVMYERLKEYKAQFGHCLVPKRYPEDPKLGTWVETQRAQYKRLHRAFDEASGVEAVQPNKRLDQERLAKLEEIGFAWSAKRDRGAAKPSAASAASEKKNNTNKKDIKEEPVPSFVDSYPDAFEPEVTVSAVAIPTAAASSAPTASTQIVSASAAAPSTRKQAPPKQTPARKVPEDQWESMYQRLIEYKQVHGNCMVPRKYDQDPKLAAWVEAQRVAWNREQRLALAAAKAAETTAKVAAIDFPEFTEEELKKYEDWNLNVDETTEEDAAEFVATIMAEYENAETVAAAAAAASATSKAMAQDAAKVRAAASSQKKLTKERKERLDALGFVWSLRNKRIEDHWDQMFRQLVEYKCKHGDCLVPSRYEENPKLGKWVETQRYEYTKLQRVTSTANQGSSGSSSKSNSQAAEAAAVAAENEDPAPALIRSSDSVASCSSDSKLRATNPRLTEERLRRLESIGFEWKVRNKMKRYYDKQWQDMFDRLMKFKHENGHCIVPKRYPPDMKLGTWVHTQRIQYRKMINVSPGSGKKGELIMSTEYDISSLDESIPKGEEMSYRLTEERRKRLEEAGFVWSARESSTKTDPPARVTRNSYDDLWDAMFDRLVLFKEKHGHCLVPKRYHDDPKLGTWVDTQRVQYRKKNKIGDPNEGSTSPVNGLESDFVKAEDSEESVSGTSSVPTQFKAPVGRLTDERIQRLETLGFVWSLRDDWMKHYEELKAYKAEFGNCNVPARYAKNRRLGIWVSAQRQAYKLLKSGEKAADSCVAVDVDGKKQRPASLTPERISLLNQLGFAWTIRSRDGLGETWHRRYLDLKEYKEKHGNCLVPTRYPPNPELGVWVGTQRQHYRLYQKAKENGEQPIGAAVMSEERIRQLDELGFVWALRAGGSLDYGSGAMAAGGAPVPALLAVDHIDYSAMHEHGGHAAAAAHDAAAGAVDEDDSHEIVDQDLLDHVSNFVLFLKDMPGENEQDTEWGGADGVAL